MERERRDARRQVPLAGGERASDPRPGPHLTTRDVADRLGVSTNFVVEEIQAGRLQALVIRRAGVRTLYRVSDANLDTYLARYQWTSTGLAERAEPSHEQKR
jgi:excisionase family DNA binding protein